MNECGFTSNIMLPAIRCRNPVCCQWSPSVCWRLQPREHLKALGSGLFQRICSLEKQQWSPGSCVDRVLDQERSSRLTHVQRVSSPSGVGFPGRRIGWQRLKPDPAGRLCEVFFRQLSCQMRGLLSPRFCWLQCEVWRVYCRYQLHVLL